MAVYRAEKNVGHICLDLIPCLIVSNALTPDNIQTGFTLVRNKQCHFFSDQNAFLV